jgi:hypothetical protein
MKRRSTRSSDTSKDEPKKGSAEADRFDPAGHRSPSGDEPAQICDERREPFRGGAVVAKQAGFGPPSPSLPVKTGTASAAPLGRFRCVMLPRGGGRIRQCGHVCCFDQADWLRPAKRGLSSTTRVQESTTERADTALPCKKTRGSRHVHVYRHPANQPPAASGSS